MTETLSWKTLRKVGVYYLLDRMVHTGVRVSRVFPTPRVPRYQVWEGEGKVVLKANLHLAKLAAVSHYRAMMKERKA